jgi:hypothetical protein
MKIFKNPKLNTSWKGVKVQSTVYPFEYNLNAARNRNTRAFAKAFNSFNFNIKCEIDDLQLNLKNQLSKDLKVA